jgi:hypothetical protein
MLLMGEYSDACICRVPGMEITRSTPRPAAPPPAS